MAIRTSIFHQTTYHYRPKTSLGPQVVRLRPAPHCRSSIVGYSLDVQPGGHFINWQQDPYNNWLARVVFPEDVKTFQVTVDLVLDLSPINPFDFFLEPEAKELPFTYEEHLMKDLQPYLEILPKADLGPTFESIAKDLAPGKGVHTVDHLVKVNSTIHDRLDYTLRMEPGVQSPCETLKLNRGSCRDFAWLLVQLLRRQGFAARFVSGYSVQLTADIKAIDGPVGVLNDVVDLHAWVEAYLPGAGWIGMDATSGMLCTEGHIPLAASPSPGQSSPIEGSLTECEVEFEHNMKVSRIHEDPRVTKPYREGEWEAIERLGQSIDTRILDNDIRLTMGGEPTFVSTDDYEAEEWNEGAVGLHKLDRSVVLAKALRPKCGFGSLLHSGQGKWYPGESLPRWAFSIYWRKDGQPIWVNDDLLADSHVDLGHTNEDALRFLEALTEHLQISEDTIHSAHEDPLYYIYKEGRLPPGVDAFDNQLDNEEDRQRMRRVFENGLGNPVGYVLPIQKVSETKGPGRWQSGLWLLRGQRKAERRLFMIPGDSPVGLRLPLPSLEGGGAVNIRPVDPTAQQRPLPTRSQLKTAIKPEPPGAQNRNEQSLDSSVGGTVPTALTVESREGLLRIFMPPVQELEDYLELLTAIEECCEATKLPVAIEGYTPPEDPRLEVLKVTPDPGVIEVNVAPSKNWAQLSRSTRDLYETARECRLGTEKFMQDGRHTGTGGGNHIVVGAATALDSPFLRRPDLLRSVLTIWNHHPSLSYLFSSLFIGPTSQAPRVDEGRVDAVDELELAMQQYSNYSEPAPWQVDRWFRNLLTDLTGNTHRSEICIDKLYSPDSPTGRLGLVEFRGFEMPPHPEMSLTTQLLIRAILVMAWEAPCTEPLMKWGTELHDRFLLPHDVWADLCNLLGRLRRHGMDFEESWFRTHFEFRFPIAGSVDVDGTHIELRHAIEPWNVLGEEPAAGGTARSVDSSLERLQVSLSGFDPRRHALSLNGVKLPLRKVGTDRWVLGIKFRAWQPPHCLHPTIGVHAPLTFDLVDLASSKALGGCQYHTHHPGGVSYEDRPVNALSAESRRKERFFDIGHTAGHISLREPPLSQQGKCTLDLRYMAFES